MGGGPPRFSKLPWGSETNVAPHLCACRAGQRDPALHEAWESALGANSRRSLLLPRRAGRPSLSLGIVCPSRGVCDSLGQPRPRRCEAVVAWQARRLAHPGCLRRRRVCRLPGDAAPGCVEHRAPGGKGPQPSPRLLFHRCRRFGAPSGSRRPTAPWVQIASAAAPSARGDLARQRGS